MGPGSMIRDKLDRPLKSLRVSVTDRCNFRCVFCMPSDGDYQFYAREEILSFEEITRVVRVSMSLGVEKVRITGGEPLLRRHLERLVEMIHQLGIKDISLTTNGFLLKEKAQTLKTAGLKRVTVSLPSLRDETFSKLVGKDVKVAQVIEGIEKAIDVGLTPVKVNVCVIKGLNDDEVVEIAGFFKKMGVVVRFIEFMDVGTLNGWSLDKVFSADDILSLLSRYYKFRTLGREYGETSLKFVYEDDGVEFGVIPSITKPFCGSCTRLRLTADGTLYTCLFSSKGYNLKELLRGGRSDEEIKDFIRSAWESRDDRYSEERLERLEKHTRKVEMFKVGG